MTLFLRQRFSGKAHVALKASAGILAVAVLATSALAQVREIPQGHILDVNPQVGSGGSNTPVPGYTPINSNAIIYGQVSGLGSFHGNTVGSPDVFQGNLPSAGINNFVRQSAPLAANGAPQPFILPSRVVSTDSGQLYSAPINGGFQSRLIPGDVINPVTAPPSLRSGTTSAINYRAIDTSVPSGPAVSSDTPGYGLWSPLFATRPEITQNDDNTSQQRITPEKAGETTNPNQPLPKANPDQTDNNHNPAASPDKTQSKNPLGPQGSELVTGRPDFNLERNITGGTGNQGTQTPGGAADLNGRPRDIGRTAMINDTYRTLQGELEKRAALAKVKSEEAVAAKAPGLPGEALGHHLAGDMTPAVPGTAGGAHRAPAPGSLAAEPDSTLRAGQDLPPLKTLADVPSGGVPTPFDTQLKEAETQLKAGKYLDAMDTYQHALVAQPENALGLVGRAHAELGAGMYESAAYDLKFLYTKKPAMASVHYALAEVIPAKRIDALMADLLKLTTEDKSENTASFLYCYLAYNTDHPQELKDELQRWGIRPTHDEWQAVAAKAWGK